MRHNLCKCAVFFILLLSSLFSACSTDTFQKTEVLLKFPTWPPADPCHADYPPLDSWYVVVNYGNICVDFYMPAFAEGFPVQLNGNEPTAILAYPVTYSMKIFNPSGTVLPLWENLGWQTGFTALMLHKFYLMNKNTDDISFFSQKINWKKINDTVSEKSLSSGFSYNPFLLNQEKILSSLNSLELSAQLFTLKKCSSVSLDHFKDQKMGTYLSGYIPQNTISALTGTVTVSRSVPSKFLCISPEPKIVLALLDSSEILSVSYDDLPIK